MTKKAKLVNLKPIQKDTLEVSIESTSPMIQHRWSEKARRQLREINVENRKTKDRVERDAEQEAKDATYLTADGKYGIPAGALANCIIGAAHNDLGVAKTLVRKALFVKCDDPAGVLEINCTPPETREDFVRIGRGGTDLRYRPIFHKWFCTFTVEYDSDLLNREDVVNLIERAGFGVGLCEWRPACNGDFGRFQVVADRSSDEEVAA